MCAADLAQITKTSAKSAHYVSVISRSLDLNFKGRASREFAKPILANIHALACLCVSNPGTTGYLAPARDALASFYNGSRRNADAERVLREGITEYLGFTRA